MENPLNIESKIKQTLNAFEGINSAEPKLFFYARLHARMEKEFLHPKTVLGFQLKPVYAYSVIMVLIIINAFTISNFKNHQNNPSYEDSYSLYQAE